MKQKTTDVIFQNSVFVWVATATAAVLLIPLIAMQVSPEVRWDLKDFAVMGLLLFGSGSLFVLVARRVPRRRRVIIGVMIVMAFLYVWAELAVGVYQEQESARQVIRARDG